MNEKQHIPAGYKSSPLGIIPEDWEVKRLGDLGEVLMCKRIMKYQTDFFGDIPFFKIGTFGGKPDAYISREVFDEYKTKYSYPKIGDVLISAAGTIGRSVIFDGTPSYYQDSNIVWIDNDNKQVLNKYLYYYYSTINWITDTGTIPRLYNSALKAIQIPTPPIEQQTRIVSILELWDTAIAKQTALIEKLTLRKRGLMQQLLTGKKRLKGFEGKWKEVRLGEIARITMGQSPDSKYYNEIGLGLPLIQGNADIQDKKSIQRFWTSSITKTCEGGDIIMSVRAPVGEIAIATQKSCIGRGVCAIKNTSIEKKYLYQLLLFEEDSWKNIEQGGTFTAINSNEIRNKAVIIPATDEQNAIASVLVNADKEIEIQKQKLAAMQEQKKGLMQVLLTGKKRVTI